MSSVESISRAAAPAVHRTEELLAEFGPPVAAEVARVLGAEAALRSDVTLFIQELRHKHRVYRISAVGSDSTRSVIIKRLDPPAAQRIRLALERWLPWLGLPDIGVALLGSAAAGADWIWHVYEDGGDATLHQHRCDRALITSAVSTIAELHTSAASHPVAVEGRRDGCDLGMPFLTNSVGDALRLLDLLEPAALRRSASDAQLVDRLRRHLAALLDDAPRRARVMAEAGGPVTLLHGDLWTTNILLHPAGRHGSRLIDWDRVGAGSFTYDLSTLLYRFAAAERLWIFECYRAAVARAGQRLASIAELNLLFDTAERARSAYRISWPAIAILQDGADWGFGALAEIDGWFQALEPAIPQ